MPMSNEEKQLWAESQKEAVDQMDDNAFRTLIREDVLALVERGELPEDTDIDVVCQQFCGNQFTALSNYKQSTAWWPSALITHVDSDLDLSPLMPPDLATLVRPHLDISEWGYTNDFNGHLHMAYSAAYAVVVALGLNPADPLKGLDIVVDGRSAKAAKKRKERSKTPKQQHAAHIKAARADYDKYLKLRREERAAIDAKYESDIALTRARWEAIKEVSEDDPCYASGQTPAEYAETLENGEVQ